MFGKLQQFSWVTSLLNPLTKCHSISNLVVVVVVVVVISLLVVVVVVVHVGVGIGIIGWLLLCEDNIAPHHPGILWVSIPRHWKYRHGCTVVAVIIVGQKATSPCFILVCFAGCCLRSIDKERDSRRHRCSCFFFCCSFVGSSAQSAKGTDDVYDISNQNNLWEKKRLATYRYRP